MPQPTKNAAKKRPVPTRRSPVIKTPKASSSPHSGAEDDVKITALKLPRGELSPEMDAYFKKCDEKLGFVPNVLKATLGLPIQLVSGYKGTADVRLAFNSGEVAGLSNSWESTKSTWRKELESGELKLVLQATLKPHPEFPKLPMALNYAKNDEAKRLISTVARVHGPTVRPYVLPPNTPKERVEIIRKAFMDTMKDPEFLAEAKKANLDINPDDGAILEQNVKDILKLEPGLIAKLKEILK